MRADRLLKLAGFLEILRVSKFDFGTDICGSSTCAIGWCSAVFSNLCDYQRPFPNVIRMKDDHNLTGFQDVSIKLFNISIMETYFLFCPKLMNGNSPNTGMWKWINRMLLNKNCKAKDVSNRIRKFVDYKLRKEHAWKQYEYEKFGCNVTNKREICI